MGQGKSGPQQNGRPRLKLAHAIYMYGTRPMQLETLIVQLEDYDVLGRSQIRDLIRQLRGIKRGLVDDYTAMKRDRLFQRQLENILDYLHRKNQLYSSELKKLIEVLNKLRIDLAEDFHDIYTALY